MSIASQYIRGKGYKVPPEIWGRTWVDLPIIFLAAGSEPILIIVVAVHTPNNISLTLPNPEITIT